MACWYVYIVRCSDNTLYTGITINLARRLLEHNSGPKGSRYTRSRRPVALVYCEQAASRSAATSREAHIKKLKISEKGQLVAQQEKISLTTSYETIPHDLNPDC
jgi:putative endonuclease